MLEGVVERLGPLVEEMVFLGGCATGLLITDPAAPGIRATQDVDALVEVASRREYHRLSRALRTRGFAEDDSPEPLISRWRHGPYVLDVMPTDPSVLGFGNPWYELAFGAAERAVLPSGNHIRCVSAPSFLATKLAAFDGRGAGDYLASHDIEDFIAVVDGRGSIVDEVHAVDARLASYLAARVGQLLDDPVFGQALAGLLPGDPGSQARLAILRQRLEFIAGRNR